MINKLIGYLKRGRYINEKCLIYSIVCREKWQTFYFLVLKSTKIHARMWYSIFYDNDKTLQIINLFIQKKITSYLLLYPKLYVNKQIVLPPQSTINRIFCDWITTIFVGEYPKCATGGHQRHYDWRVQHP